MWWCSCNDDIVVLVMWLCWFGGCDAGGVVVMVVQLLSTWCSCERGVAAIVIAWL